MTTLYLAGGFVLLAVVAAAFALDRMAQRITSPPRRPYRGTPSDLDLDLHWEDVEIDGTPTLRGWLLSPGGGESHDVRGPDRSGEPAASPDPDRSPAVAVLCHGWGTNGAVLLTLGAELARAGHPTLLFDVRSHGRSEEASHVTIRQFRDDVERAVAWTEERFPDRTRVVGGHSMGGAAAILAAVHRGRVHGVATVAAPADVFEATAIYMERKGLPGRRLIPLLRPFFRLRAGVPTREVTPEAQITRADVPVMIIQPETDDSVPADQARRLADAAGVEVTWVEGTDHSSVLEADATARHLLELLRRV